MTNNGSTHKNVYDFSYEQRQELAHALLQRPDTSVDAEAAFRRKYPTAPDEMIKTAAFHVYVDGPEAVITWLADAELFLRDPEHTLCYGVTWDLLYHVYNWQQFQALLPEGTPQILVLLKQLRELADEGELEGVKQTSKDLEEMFEGNVDPPYFDFP